MKVLKFKGRITFKNILLIIIGLLILISGIVGTIIYSVNEEARDWININLLNREVTEDDVATIKLDSDKNQFIYAYDKYIVILCNGKLESYTSYGAKTYELDIQISNPIFETNGSYLVIGENNGQKIYLIEERKSFVGCKG